MVSSEKADAGLGACAKQMNAATAHPECRRSSGKETADGNDNVRILNFVGSNSPIVELCGERTLRFTHLSALFQLLICCRHRVRCGNP